MLVVTEGGRGGEGRGGTVLTTQKSLLDQGLHWTSAASQLVVLCKYRGASYGLSKSTTNRPLRLDR